MRHSLRGRTSALLAVCAATATLLAGAVSPATASSHVSGAPRSVDTGLYGASDPTYDGVLRQSYALLGLAAVGRPAPADALRWLVRQQCQSGAFQGYVVPNSPCSAASPTTFTGPDTNSTALAALALHAHGKSARAVEAVQWLLRQQARNGGWAWISGLAQDALSTGLVLQALRAGIVPAEQTARAIERGERFIAARILPCTAAGDQRGGIVGSFGGDADVFTSASALLGLTGTLPVHPTSQKAAAPVLRCGTEVTPAEALSRFLLHRINAGDGLMASAFGPYNVTALAVLGLVAARLGGAATTEATAALGRTARAYIGRGDATSPAALGTLLLLAHATGMSPTSFGSSGVNLLTRLAATRR